MEEEEEEYKSDEEEMTKKKNVPLHVKLQTRCLELCTHLISHPNRTIRLDVVELVRELAKNLAEHTNDFLPLVHKLWSPMCQRFSLDTDLIVKSRILFALLDLCVLSGDFLTQRFVKEFMPRLASFMRDQVCYTLYKYSSFPLPLSLYLSNVHWHRPVTVRTRTTRRTSTRTRSSCSAR